VLPPLTCGAVARSARQVRRRLRRVVAPAHARSRHCRAWLSCLTAVQGNRANERDVRAPP
jgi:truncated hemoglobin YjbI